jgi:hypothetical protein
LRSQLQPVLQKYLRFRISMDLETVTSLKLMILLFTKVFLFIVHLKGTRYAYNLGRKYFRPKSSNYDSRYLHSPINAEFFALHWFPRKSSFFGKQKSKSPFDSRYHSIGPCLQSFVLQLISILKKSQHL